MQYLGGLRGAGILTRGNEMVASANYDFDGFLTEPGKVTCCGEIRMPPRALREVFGRKDLQLLTEEGRLLSLRFSERRLRSETDVAHVDVAGELPSVSEWRH